jgi:hypothetical protein
MADEALSALLRRLQTTNARFPLKLVWLLIHVREYPEHAGPLGLRWRPGGNLFYSNTNIVAIVLGLKGPNSVAKDFKQHGFKTEKRDKSQKADLHSLPDCRQWKIRWHPLLQYDCDESAAKRIVWHSSRTTTNEPIQHPQEVANELSSTVFADPEQLTVQTPRSYSPDRSMGATFDKFEELAVPFLSRESTEFGFESLDFWEGLK